MSKEIKFDLDGDIIMQIEMDSYMKYNDTIASMNDHLGEIYGYLDVRDTEEAKLKYEKKLAYKAIVQLQQKVEQLEKENEQLRTELNTKDNIINYIWQVFKNGSFEDGCDCIEIYDYLKQLKGE